MLIKFKDGIDQAKKDQEGRKYDYQKETYWTLLDINGNILPIPELMQ